MASTRVKQGWPLVVVVLVGCGQAPARMEDSRPEKPLILPVSRLPSSVTFAQNGEELVRGKLGEEYPPCTCATFSPDGKRLASVHFDRGLIGPPHAVCLWDVTAGRSLHKSATLFFDKNQPHQYEESLHYLVFSPDGSLLATRHANDSTIVWETATGKERRLLKTEGLAVAFTPDGRRLVCVSRTGQVRHWNLTTGKCQDSLAGTKSEDFLYVRQAVASADGKRLAIMDGYTVVVKDVRTGKRLRHFGDLDHVSDLALSTDGKFLRVGRADGAIYFDSTTGQEFRSGPTRRRQPEADAHPSVALEARLLSRKESYPLDLGGKTPMEFAPQFKVGNPLPDSPEVDFVLLLKNTGAKPILIDPDGTFFSYLVGDGAVNHPELPYQTGFIRGDRSPPERISLAPGETYSVPLKSLDCGHGHRSWWLLPGEYTLRVSYHVRVQPALDGWRKDEDGSGSGTLEAPPLLVKVVEKK